MAKQKRPSKRPHKPISKARARGLELAYTLMDQRRWLEARPLLVSLVQKVPDDVPVLRALAQVEHELQELPDYLRRCQRLHRLLPHEHLSALLAEPGDKTLQIQRAHGGPLRTLTVPAAALKRDDFQHPQL